VLAVPYSCLPKIWIAISTYVLVAILKKRLLIQESLYTILQVLSVTLFEKSPILEVLRDYNTDFDKEPEDIQLNLFNL
jgi:hypothetical protein